MITGIKMKLFAGNDPSIGSWITLAHPAIAEIMANAGFDWLAVDLEHSVINIREAEELIRIIHLSGVVPLVRLTSHNPDLIKRGMDAGAHGVIAPMVNSVRDAERVVSAVKYPPLGERGVGLARAQKYGIDFNNYREWLVNDAAVIAQIEHIDAVNNFREIMSVPGIDGYIIGPYDLTSSMGIAGEFDHPDYIEAVDRVGAIARELNVTGGIHVVEPDMYQLQTRIQEGYKFIGYSIDMRMLDASCRAALSTLKEIK